MNTFWHNRFLCSALGAVLAVLCGGFLWWTPFGEPLENASYDYLFRFGTRAITNDVVLILMDNDAFDQFHQTRGQPWDRSLHTQLLNRLADDGCAVAVFDSFFQSPRDPVVDAALAAAMRRQKNVVLMAEQSSINHPGLDGAKPNLPAEIFLAATGTNWGVASLTLDKADNIVRRHWPFPAPGPYPDLPQTVARLAGARLDAEPSERWIRYYGENGAWPVLGYRFALTQPANYFRGKIVFIGTQPKTFLPTDPEADKFKTPYTRCWSGETSGGVEILLTETLNLINGDWLRRPAPWLELLVLAVAGGGLGGGLGRLRTRAAGLVAGGVALFALIGAIALSHFSNHWFPWLLIAGGQVPCALAWAGVVNYFRLRQTRVKAGDAVPKIRGYKLFPPAIGEGAYGKVWLARSRAGQWRAIKVVYRKKFGDQAEPYTRELAGINRYQPVSSRHPGLLDVDFVSLEQAGFFYYVMELGDSLVPDWQREPVKYRVRDLVTERAAIPSGRLPIGDCVRIVLTLADALDFLHRQGLTHRDIKPQNIIFVNGQPKLADPGLVAVIRPQEEIKTYLGTPGFMPPAPELPGTPAADIFALGMVLYVISTGHAAALFPEIATTLVSQAAPQPPDFLALNQIILKACDPHPADRYATAADFRDALAAMQKQITGP